MMQGVNMVKVATVVRVLPQAMHTKTGVSWNKRFKKQFGSINKVPCTAHIHCFGLPVPMYMYVCMYVCACMITIGGCT